MNTDIALSPTPRSMTRDFSGALKLMLDGKKVTRLQWSDNRVYCLLQDGILQLHKAGEAPDVLHPWIINDGDLLGTDWTERL